MNYELCVPVKNDVISNLGFGIWDLEFGIRVISD